MWQDVLFVIFYRAANSQIGLPFWLLLVNPWKVQDVGSSKKRIALHIKEKALEKMIEFANAKTTTLEDFDFVVETLNEATGVPKQELVGDIIEIGIQGGQKRIEAGEGTIVDVIAPEVDGFSGLRFGMMFVKNSAEIVAKIIS